MKFQRAIFFDSHLDKLFNLFRKEFEVVQAGGGLVYAPQNKILLIFRQEKWDLPKGKLDPGENIQACALREIREETGLQKLEIEQPLRITYHTYIYKEKQILKECYWFLIKSLKQEKLSPQLEEDIEKCVWIDIDEVESYLDNVYSSVSEVLKEGIEILQKKKTAS